MSPFPYKLKHLHHQDHGWKDPCKDLQPHCGCCYPFPAHTHHGGHLLRTLNKWGGAHGAKIRKRIHTHLIFILMGSHTLLGAHIYFHNLLTILAEFLLVLSCVCLTQEMLICCLFLKASASLQVSLCTIQQKPELILILKKMMIFYF